MHNSKCFQIFLRYYNEVEIIFDDLRKSSKVKFENFKL